VFNVQQTLHGTAYTAHAAVQQAHGAWENPTHNTITEHAHALADTQAWMEHVY